jgi:(p)ppGpp synthase/HD superfamily hydrolase
MADLSTASVASADIPQAALVYARTAHRGQRRRQNGNPFIEHPVAVADLLAADGQPDDIVAAGYLHDTVEKCDVGIADIRRRFGEEVASIVAALSEDKSVEAYEERKRALRAAALAAGNGAAIVYAADRLANMRDWVAMDDEGRDAAARRLGTSFASRLDLWRDDLTELAAHDPEPPFLAEIEIELRNLS